MRPSDKNKPPFLLVLLSLSAIFAFGLICIIGSGGGGGGGGGSDGGTETAGAGSDIIEIKTVLGPIVGADVWVAPLDDTSNLLSSGTTQDAEDLNEAGHVSLEVPEAYRESPLYLNASGGVDIDVGDDGVRDETPTNNDITIDFAVPSAEDLEGVRIVANPLLLYASPYVISGLSVEANLPEGYEPSTDSEAVRTVIRRISKALIEEDIDGDGIVGWEDIVSFHPLIDQEKSRIPWEYVLDEIERRRQDFDSRLELTYDRYFYLDPSTLYPFDWNADGDWRDGGGHYDDFIGDSANIVFRTTMGGYTTQDLIDGQGIVGGTVIPPEGAVFSYFWDDQEGNSGFETDVSEPWLIALQGTSGYDEDRLVAAIGGTITEPDTIPVGAYTINYKTGDGLEHEQTLYLYENTEESFFYAIPLISVDADGFIESITWRFEDENGNEIEDPPILYGWFDINVTPIGKAPMEVSEYNTLVREEDYYAQATFQEMEYTGLLFASEMSLVAPSSSFYPTNNNHKIYYEDALYIAAAFHGGDGVTRSYNYGVHDDLYPNLAEWLAEDGQITVRYNPASATGREVLIIRYKFDDNGWAEFNGDTLTVDIPEGASTLYVTAKDTAGFYLYPPNEIDLTE